MFSDIDTFLQALRILKEEIIPEAEIEIVYKRVDKISVRILITPVIFIDIYANTETSRYDVSLIKRNTRIFGYDNLGGWHYHPVGKPDSHINCDEPSLSHIFKQINSVLFDDW